SVVKEHACSDQHVDALKIDTVKETVNEISIKIMQRSEIHILRILKINLHLLLIVLTYENEISGHEFAFAISNTIKLLALEKYNAATITTKLVYLFQNNNVIDKLVAFASDALVCKDTQKQLKCFIDAEAIMKDIYKFYKNSAQQIHVFQEYQKILDCPELHLKKLKYIQ
ncbi:13901_t:CDS:2, partial [Dentiscutata heterogama]